MGPPSREGGSPSAGGLSEGGPGEGAAQRSSKGFGSRKWLPRRLFDRFCLDLAIEIPRESALLWLLHRVVSPFVIFVVTFKLNDLAYMAWYALYPRLDTGLLQTFSGRRPSFSGLRPRSWCTGFGRRSFQVTPRRFNHVEIR